MSDLYRRAMLDFNSDHRSNIIQFNMICLWIDLVFCLLCLTKQHIHLPSMSECVILSTFTSFLLVMLKYAILSTYTWFLLVMPVMRIYSKCLLHPRNAHDCIRVLHPRPIYWRKHLRWQDWTQSSLISNRFSDCYQLCL